MNRQAQSINHPQQRPRHNFPHLLRHHLTITRVEAGLDALAVLGSNALSFAGDPGHVAIAPSHSTVSAYSMIHSPIEIVSRVKAPTSASIEESTSAVLLAGLGEALDLLVEASKHEYKEFFDEVEKLLQEFIAEGRATSTRQLPEHLRKFVNGIRKAHGMDPVELDTFQHHIVVINKESGQPSVAFVGELRDAIIDAAPFLLKKLREARHESEHGYESRTYTTFPAAHRNALTSLHPALELHRVNLWTPTPATRNASPALHRVLYK